MQRLHIYYPRIIYSINVSEIFWYLYYFRVCPTSDYFHPSPLVPASETFCSDWTVGSAIVASSDVLSTKKEHLLHAVSEEENTQVKDIHMENGQQSGSCVLA
jgi:hypothetical protein